MIYSVSGIPNDIEENMFWKLCRQTDIVHGRNSSDRHSSKIESYDAGKFNLFTLRKSVRVRQTDLVICLFKGKGRFRESL